MNISSSDDDVLDNQSLPVELPENVMPVTPIVAPTQDSYFVSGDECRINNRCCSAAPFGCPHLDWDCSRQGWKNCLLVKRLVWVPALENEQQAIINEFHQERARERSTKQQKMVKNMTFVCLLSQGHFRNLHLIFWLKKISTE